MNTNNLVDSKIIAKAIQQFGNASDKSYDTLILGLQFGAYIFCGEDGLSPEALINRLSSVTDPEDKAQIVLELITSKIASETAKELADAIALIARITDPGALDALIKSGRGIALQFPAGEDGIARDATGAKVEDNFFNPLPGKTPAPGQSETTIPIDKGSLTITRDNKSLLSAIIAEDIKKNSDVIWRYICEIGVDSSHNAVGRVRDLRNSILQSLKESLIPELKSGKLFTMIEVGNVLCMTHAAIGAMQTLEIMPVSDLQMARECDIERYIDWIRLFGATKAADQQMTMPDAALQSFRDETGRPLSGIDSTGSLVSGNANTLECIRRYLRHLAQSVATKLMSTFINGGRNCLLMPEITQVFQEVMSFKP